MDLSCFGWSALTRTMRTLAPSLLGLLVNCHGAALNSAVPAVGMHLSTNSYWMANAPFLDRFRYAVQFVAVDTAYKKMPPGAVAIDANGYPLAIPPGARDISTYIALDPIALPMTDRYVLTYKGRANFKLPGTRLVGSQPGRITFDYIKPNDTMLQVTINEIDPANPPHDIHVVREDQQANFAAGEVFNPAFLEKARNWSTLRMMDWLNTNASDPVDWAKRPTPASMSWTQHGIPLEIAIRLANEAHTNIWLNIPTLADDNYVRNMATLVKAQLDPGHKAYFEYSNEVWNWGFKAAHIAQHQGNLLWGKDANGDGKIDDGNPAENYGPGWLTWYGLRSAQMASIVRHVFTGPDRGRAMPVLSSQTYAPGREKAVLDGVGRAKLGTVGELFDAFAITTYFGGEFGQQSGGPDLQTLLGWARGGEQGLTAAFAQLRTGGALAGGMPLSGLPAIYAHYSQLAAANGLKLVAYEGGAHLTAWLVPREQQPEVVDLLKRLMNDPRMGDLYTQMIADFGAAGGSEVVILSDVGEAKASGYWGVLDTIYQASSPRYDAIKAAAARWRAANTGRGH